MERDFKGIWIPREIWLSKKLTLQEKIFYVEIHSLDNSEGCYASNSYFSKFFGISIVRVSIIISKLIEKGYVSSTIISEKGNQRILKTINPNLAVPLKMRRTKGPIKKSLIPIKKSLIPSLRNVYDPLKLSLMHNNTYNNTIIFLKTLQKEKKFPFYRGAFKNIWELEFLPLKIKKKASISERAIISQLNKINNWTGGDYDTALTILEKSVNSGWCDVYPLSTSKIKIHDFTKKPNLTYDKIRPNKVIN